MARLLALAFVAASQLSAALTVTLPNGATSLSFVNRSYKTSYKSEAIYFPKTLITVTATAGTWTWATSSSLITPCPNQGVCFRITGQFNSTAIGTGAQGTTVVALNWYPGSISDMVAGTYTGSVQFSESGGGTVTIPISLTLVDDTVFPTTPTPKYTATATPSCTTQTAPTGMASYAGVCPIANEAPMVSPSIVRPAVGGTYDGSFGNTVTRLTDESCSTEYGTTYPFSALDTYIFTSCGIYVRATGALLRSSAVYPHNLGLTSGSMHPTDDSSLYYYDGATVMKWNYVLNTAAVVVGDFSVAPYNIQSIGTGGTQPVSNDGWYAFFDDGNGADPPAYNNGHSLALFTVCAVNLVRLETDGAPANTNTYCTTFTPLSGAPAITQVDWVGTTEVDTVTGERYVYASSNPFAALFTVGAVGSGTLTQKYIVGETLSTGTNNYNGLYETGETFVSAANFTHGALCKDSDGRIKMGQGLTDSVNVIGYRAFFPVNGGNFFQLPEEQHGAAAYQGINNYDTQPGCSSALGAWGMVMSPDYNRWYDSLGSSSTGSPNPVYSGGNVTVTPPLEATTWSAGATYVLSSLIVDSANHWQRITTAGTVGSVLPTFNHAGGTTTDGTAVWTDLGTTAPPALTWMANRWYPTGAIVVDPSNHFQRSTSPATGVSGAVAPTWNDAGGTTPDGTFNWLDLGTSVSLIIDNATAPWTCLNASFSGATATAAGVITVSAPGCSGQAGTINAGALIGYAGPDSGTGIKQDRSFALMWRPGKQVTPVAFHRGVSWVNLYGTPILQYNTQPRGGPSRSGCYMHWNSNMGSLAVTAGGNTSVYWTPTGLCGGNTISSVLATGGQLTGMLAYSVTGAASCTIDVSAGSSFFSVLRTITDNQPVASRQISLGALSAGTNYWVRVQCGKVVETSTFRTSTAVSPVGKTIPVYVGNPKIPGATQLSIGYRVPGGSFSFTSNAACTGGCATSFPGTVGEINEYELVWKNAGGTTLLTTSSAFVAMPGTASTDPALSWAALTSSQWAALTSASWSTLTP